MAENDPNSEDFLQFLRRMLGENAEGMDLSALQGMEGLNLDPAMMQQLMQQMQHAMNGDPWETTLRQALHIANRDGLGIGTGARTSIADAFALADLWVGESTTISELAAPPRALTRGEWVRADPSGVEGGRDAGVHEHRGRSDDRARGADAGGHAAAWWRAPGASCAGIGSSVFAMQFGQVLGNLSLEVVSGGDVGIPVLPAGTAAVIPQNLAAFGEGLEIPEDQIALYLAARELAYARLYRHARWLHLHVMSQITEFAKGVTVDADALEDLASRLDPNDPEELRRAIEGGALLPAQSEAQREALERLENLIATIDGWVDVVTTQATSRLPDSTRIAEAARRRRAAGGPAEDALGALVGLRIRPRRLREAAAMWQAVTDAVGIEARDALWDYPDLMPDASDIDDPAALVARLQARARGEEPAQDEMDEALERLLSGEDFPGPSEDGGDEGSGGSGDEGSGEKPV